MTPKEKASELVDKMLSRLKNKHATCGKCTAKELSIISVNEILKGSRLFYKEDYDYWQEVKQEIEKL